MRFITPKAHTIIGIAIGVILLFAPSIFNFTDNAAASAIPMYVGIFIIISELTTTSRLSLIKLVPMRIHLAIDYATGVFLLLSPWLFGFSNAPANTWVPHVIVGLLIVAYALATKPEPATDNATV